MVVTRRRSVRRIPLTEEDGDGDDGADPSDPLVKEEGVDGDESTATNSYEPKEFQYKYFAIGIAFICIVLYILLGRIRSIQYIKRFAESPMHPKEIPCPAVTGTRYYTSFKWHLSSKIVFLDI